MTCIRFSILTMTIAGMLVVAANPARAQEVRSENLLATELNRAARTILEAEPLAPTDIEAALVLVEEATRLLPDASDQWRLLLKIATLADRQDLIDQTLGTILRLDPEDELTRLMRLTGAIDRFQTIEQRLAASGQLLAEANRSRLGPAVASRLALDLALLHQRSGNSEAFGQWLAEAVVIDPANREAAALAAGFFSANLDDAFAEAELLSSLLLADPTDLSAQSELARLLLDAGAYAGAERIYEMLKAGMGVEGYWMDDDMLADLASVKWALGKTDEAITLIQRRQLELDEAFRQQSATDQPTLLANELASLRAPKSTVLATVRAAIRNRTSGDQAEPTFLDAQAAYAREIGELEQLEGTESQRAQKLLEKAWIEIWLGGKAETARETLQAAHALLPLNDAALSRAEGWFALRTGDPDQAIEFLQPLAEADPVARLGLALAHSDLNHQRDAARQLLHIARDQPGTLMGIWSADLLAALIGQRVTLSDLAMRLNTLIDSLPKAFDRYPVQSSAALGFKIRAVKRLFIPFEPILIDLELTNHTSVPLTVGPQGPIRPQIVLFPTISFAREGVHDQPGPFVIDIDRVLRLEPRGRTTIHLDLRHYHFGSILNTRPLDGASLTITGMINFHARSDGIIEPGLLGSTASLPFMRVNGVNITDGWIQHTLDELQAADHDDLPALVKLSQVAIKPAADDATPRRIELQDQAKATVLATYPRLDAVEQAWVLSVLPKHEAFQPLLNMARKSEHRLVKLAYLLFQRTGADDPMLDAATRGDDEVIRTVAEMIRSQAQREAEAIPTSTLPDNADGIR